MEDLWVSLGVEAWSRSKGRGCFEPHACRRLLGSPTGLFVTNYVRYTYRLHVKKNIVVSSTV